MANKPYKSGKWKILSVETVQMLKYVFFNNSSKSLLNKGIRSAESRGGVFSNRYISSAPASVLLRFGESYAPSYASRYKLDVMSEHTVRADNQITSAKMMRTDDYSGQARPLQNALRHTQSL